MALRSRLEEEYSAPLDVVLERDPPPGIGDDHVCAVNLTRPITLTLTLTLTLPLCLTLTLEYA